MGSSCSSSHHEPPVISKAPMISKAIPVPEYIPSSRSLNVTFASDTVFRERKGHSPSLPPIPLRNTLSRRSSFENLLSDIVSTESARRVRSLASSSLKKTNSARNTVKGKDKSWY